MLKFERLPTLEEHARWGEVSGPNFQRIIAYEGRINIAGDMEIESPADLAELRRVLAEAEEVAGWKEQGK